MTAPMDDGGLVERLKALTGPDRECDADIELLDHPELGDRPWHYFGRGWWGDTSDPHGDNKVRALNYTASLDAALTLVPEGYYWDVCSKSETHPPIAFIVPDMGKSPWPKWVNNLGVKAATPAIALCLAALAARRAQVQS